MPELGSIIFIAKTDIESAASKRPIGYVKDCMARALYCTPEGNVAYERDVYFDLVKKYSKYSKSEADPYRRRISGCCDRADQY